MSIVTPDQGDGSSESAQLDVVVLHARDAEAATAGGADRLLLSADPEEGHYSPEPAVVSAVVRETDVPVWVVLRTRETSHDSRRPAGRPRRRPSSSSAPAASPSASSTATWRSTARRCAEMCAELGGVPWLFHGFDAALDAEHAWRDVSRAARAGVGDLGRVHARARPRRRRADRAGQARPAGGRAAHGRGRPDPRPGAVAGPGRRTPVRDRVLRPRPGGSWTRASVDVDHVRSWRMLVDDALVRALGIPTD